MFQTTMLLKIHRQGTDCSPPLYSDQIMIVFLPTALPNHIILKPPCMNIVHLSSGHAVAAQYFLRGGIEGVECVSGRGNLPKMVDFWAIFLLPWGKWGEEPLMGGQVPHEPSHWGVVVLPLVLPVLLDLPRNTTFSLCVQTLSS